MGLTCSRCVLVEVEHLRGFVAGATVWLRSFFPMKFKDMHTFSVPGELRYMVAEFDLKTHQNSKDC